VYAFDIVLCSINEQPDVHVAGTVHFFWQLLLWHLRRGTGNRGKSSTTNTAQLVGFLRFSFLHHHALLHEGLHHGKKIKQGQPEK
jgi:hypothetical protein